MQTEDNSRWTIPGDVRTTYSPDGAVLLQINKGLCYSLNSVAALVWKVIETHPEGTSLTNIVSTLESEFDTSTQKLTQDFSECLERLQEAGLVLRADTTSSPMKKKGP